MKGSECSLFHRYLKTLLVVLLISQCGAVLAARAADAATPAIEKLDSNFAAKDASGEWLWYGAKDLTVEGKGWTETDRFYDRLPAKAKGVVPDPVWNLSRHSAGMCVRFVTDSPRISARWKVLNDSLAMAHMPATGVSGLDLYVNDNGVWRWIGNGRPKEQTTEQQLVSGIPEGSHEYALYLPLYNGTEALELGVVPTAAIAKAPSRHDGNEKPLLFYGTSITHGGCASRPGMAYPAILGRRLNRPAINLGFSGNGKMEMEMEALLAEVDVAAYVLDCLPNMSPEMVTERLEPFVLALRAARPGTPIVLVENIAYQSGAFIPASKSSYADKNAALRTAYERLTGQGVSGLHYVSGETLLGGDGEATVDGTHPTDLGFLRMANAIEPALRKALESR